MPEGEEIPKKSELQEFSLWETAWELGYTIAVPIVGLALLGRWADKSFDTAPWLLITGIALSVFISSFLVYRKVSKVLK